MLHSTGGHAPLHCPVGVVGIRDVEINHLPGAGPGCGWMQQLLLLISHPDPATSQVSARPNLTSTNGWSMFVHTYIIYSLKSPYVVTKGW